jgi:hypothetical protein
MIKFILMINKKISFLYCMFFNLSSEDTLNNKRLFERLNKLDNSETRMIHYEVLNPKIKYHVDFINIITGGIPKYLFWNIQKIFVNYTDLFSNKKKIEDYGLSQRNKLITYLNALKDSDNENNKKIINDFQYSNIIKDIGLDFTAFDSKSNIFEENLLILQKWLETNIFSNYHFNNHQSFSLWLKMISTRIDFLVHRPSSFTAHILSTFFVNPYGINFLFPFSIQNILKNFNNSSLLYLLATKKKFNEILKKNNYTDNENINKFFQYGMLWPLYDLFTNAKVKPFKDIPPKKDGFFTSEFEKNLNKLDINQLDTLITPHIQVDDIESIKFLRNTILYNDNIIQRLQNKEVFFLSYWITFLVTKFQNFIEKVLTKIFDSVIGYFSFKSQTRLYEFAESILIDNHENKKLVCGLKLLINNMTNKNPLPFFLIECQNFQVELLLKKYIYGLLKKYPYDISKIINPIKYTKFSLNKIGGKSYKLKELKALANKLFYENIQKFILFLKIHFLYEETKYLNFLSLFILNTLRLSYKLFGIFSNLKNLGKTIFSVIEISGLELLCAARHEKQKQNTNSMCTSTFVTYVSGNLYINKFLLAFTTNMTNIDEAVISRFTICTSISKVENLDVYIILIRRHFLDLMKTNKNIISLDKETFEKFICQIAYEFYINHWNGIEMKLFFIELVDKNRLKLYNNQYNKETILKLMKEIKV